jgi:hypothetical protein
MANHEKHIDDLLRDGLGDYTEQPPAGAWADMEAKLDDGHSAIDLFFREALGGYTEQPPAGAWLNMENKLDNGNAGFDVFFKEALSNYTEAPPVGAWADMEARLDKKPRRRRGIIWFWSAAALSGLLAVGYYFMGDNNEHHSAKRQAEVKTEAPGTPPVVNVPVPQSKEEVKIETPVATPQNKPEPVAQAPIQNTPVTQKVISQPQAPVAVEKKESPVQKAEPQVQQAPVPKQDVVAQNDSAKSIEKIEVDDIAAAIRRRANNTVMIVKKSRYADSVAEAEKIAQQKAEEEKAKQPETPVVTPPPPVIVAKVDTTDVPQQAVVVAPDTISALAKEAITETLKNMEVKQDAIPSAQLKEPAEAAIFEMSTLAAKAAETVTADSEKGSLQAFISPEAVAGAYNNMQVKGVLYPEVKARTPMKLDWFVKTGLETGIDKKTANKFVLATAVQLGITDKLSLMLQPAIKSGKVNYSQVSKGTLYHDIKSSYTDSLKTFSITHNAQGIIFDSVKQTYYYQQTHDSLMVSHNLSTRSILEAELPVMLNYKLGKNFSVYGGPVLTYSTMLSIDEKIQHLGTTTRRDTITYAVQRIGASVDLPPMKPIDEVMQYNTPNISQYNNAQYLSSNVNKLRMGYMLGASYNYKRLSADITVQQNLSRMNYIANPGVRNIYLQPYMRLMLGFKLNGNK